MSLQNFMETLRDKDKEIFDLIISDIVQQGSQEDIGKIEHELKGIKREIDITNNMRQRITQLSKRCERLLYSIDTYLLSHQDETDVSIYSLKLMLNSWIRDLKNEVLDKKPVALLEKKFKLKKDIDDRITRNKMITKFTLKENNAKT